jgi:alanine racemase
VPPSKSTPAGHSTWLEIDLGAVAHNVRRLKAIAGTGLMAVVKANGAGHGAISAARTAAQAGADWLGVARVEEGLALRAAGLRLPILVLGYTPPVDAPAALAADLSLTVFAADRAQVYNAAAQALGRGARLHVKLDTGMNRLGLPPADLPAFLQMLAGLPAVTLEGIFTHFADADDADQGFAQLQLSRFAQAVSVLTPSQRAAVLLHTANSAAALALPASRYDLVRPGISLYGLHPSSDVPCPPDFRPALTWKSVVSQVRTLAPGDTLGYGRAFKAERETRVAVVAVGYADGWRRLPPRRNEVLLRGQRLPLLGRECMDQCFVDVTTVPGASSGDEVVLIGGQGGARISAEDVARRWGTINYEVTSGLAERVTRLYTSAGE